MATSYLAKMRIFPTLLMLVLTLSACGSKQPTQAIATPANPYGNTQIDAGTNEGTDRLDLQVPALSEEELIGTYDPNDVSVRLTDLIYRLGIEIDESKNKYTYIAEDSDGLYREHTWDVQEGDKALLNPPGVGDTYQVNQYDYNGKKVMVTNMQLFNAGVECTGIGVYEYKSSGEIKTQYRYVYDDYEWDYILQNISIYDGKQAVSKATFDLKTHKRTKIEIYAVDSNMTIKEIICDGEGDLKYYYTYEYNNKKDITKIFKYDMDDNLEYSVAREYDDDGHVVKAENYNSEGRLESYTIYKWNDEFSGFEYEVYDAKGNMTDSGRQ